MQSIPIESDQTKPSDQELEAVAAKINAIPAFEIKATAVIRDAVDDVLRGGRTGRYSIEQLTRQEKAHIGTQVEIALIQEFFKNEGTKLDTRIADIEVDVKNTIGDNWMIPREAVGELCLLVLINEPERIFSIGLIRALDSILNKPNQDLKRSLSAVGRSNIRWIIHKSHLPISIFLQIPAGVRESIWDHASGQKRIRELFRQVQKVPILRSDIVALARQDDPTKRARDAKKYLRSEGILVVCGRYRKEAEQAKVRGFDLKPYEWMSLPL